jgi:hypothetical protein
MSFAIGVLLVQVDSLHQLIHELIVDYFFNHIFLFLCSFHLLLAIEIELFDIVN